MLTIIFKMRAKRTQRKPIIFGNSKEVLQAIVMIFVWANIIFGDEESQFCKKRWSEFIKDRKQWESECLNNETIRMSQCCETTADFLEYIYEKYITLCPIVGESSIIVRIW